MSNYFSRLGVPAVFLYGYVVVTQVVSGIYEAAAVEPHPILISLGPIGLLWALCCWLQRDMHSYRLRWTVDAGLWLYVGWIFVLPYHLIKTRGAKGILAILAFVAVYMGSVLAGILLFGFFDPL